MNAYGDFRVKTSQSSYGKGGKTWRSLVAQTLWDIRHAPLRLLLTHLESPWKCFGGIAFENYSYNSLIKKEKKTTLGKLISLFVPVIVLSLTGLPHFISRWRKCNYLQGNIIVPILQRSKQSPRDFRVYLMDQEGLLEKWNIVTGHICVSYGWFQWTWRCQPGAGEARWPPNLPG